MTIPASQVVSVQPRVLTAAGTLISGSGGGTPSGAPVQTPELDFSIALNSGYIALIAGF